MSAMSARVFALLAIALSLSACVPDQEKQWYKPGGNYTTAEFERDQASCTKDKKLDEDCLRALGWVSLSADPYRGAAPMQGGGTPSKERYAPK